MKKITAVLIFVVMFTACMSPTQTNTILTPSPTATNVSTQAFVTIPSPTLTPELSKYNPSATDKIRTILQGYGSVDESKLELSYWQKIDSQIDDYGAAKRILALEYHGNNYNFYHGAYSMSPDQFDRQITYLCQNDYHFVTGAEIVGYIEGWLVLPTRSIILTTDSGNKSMETIPTMYPTFDRLKKETGCQPHMISFIQTLGMNEGENPRCDKDNCWQTFRDAVNSGYFTIGSHSEQHLSAKEMTEEQLVADYTLSKNDIKEYLGLNVYSLAWPVEVCTTYLDAMKKMGFIYAYGGVDRGVGRAFTYPSDPDPMCLPRLLPPNPDGKSGRPNGMTLPNILDLAINHYLTPK